MLLENINSNKEIRPYLREYPFTPDRADVSVGNPYSANLKDNDLIFVFQTKDALYFNYQDSKQQLQYRNEIEPYEEALKKVAKQYPEILEKIRHEKIDS
jgi:phosphopentomutase